MTELDVPLARPRDRRAAVADPGSSELRERALEALGRMKRTLLVTLLLAGAVAAWAWVASLDSVDDLLVASPGETAEALRTTARCCSTTLGSRSTRC